MNGCIIFFFLYCLWEFLRAIITTTTTIIISSVGLFNLINLLFLKD